MNRLLACLALLVAACSNPSIDDFYSQGTCVKYASRGADCSATSCEDGDYCDATSRKCTELKSTEVSCADDSECQSFSCSTTTMTCAAPTPEPVTDTCATMQPTA